MKTEIGFIMRPELCIQCHACENACRTWRRPEVGTYRRIVTVERGSFPNTKVSYYSIGCLHCTDPACMAVCPSGAITKSESGAVCVDRTLCTGCGLCRSACPYAVPQFAADGTMQKCDLCAHALTEEEKYPCVRMCPSGALTIGNLSLEEKKAAEKGAL